MKKIFYGICGEGLGHTNRAISVIEHLKDEFEFHVFSSQDTCDYIRGCFSNKIKVYPIISNGFEFYKNGSINYIQTLKKIIKFYFNSFQEIKKIQLIVKKEKPNLIISDYEPLLPQVGKITKTKVISINNQHKFMAVAKSRINFGIKIYSFIAAIFNKIYIRNVQSFLVSTFHYKYLKDNHVIFTNVFIKKDINLNQKQDDFYILYSKKHNLFTQHVVDFFQKHKLKLKFYSDHPNKISSNIEFLSFNKNFSNDLNKCKAIFTTAGNQLMGECIFLKKPIYCCPISMQFEQYINAYFIEKMNVGVWAKSFTEESILDFMKNLEKFHFPTTENGIDVAIDFIKNNMKDSNDEQGN